jgi:hypothetical protein
MNKRDERIDQAVNNFIQNGEMGEELQPYSEALQALKALKAVPDMDPERARQRRRAYLGQVDPMQAPVSRRRTSRLNGWRSIFQKERSPMFAIARTITIAAILLGGTAGTAFAAQDSLPDQALYPVKTLIEDVRIGLTNDPQAEFDLLMTYIDERFAEIQSMAQNGEPVGDEVQLRLRNQFRNAFQNAAELDEPAMLQAMEQVRTKSQQQLNILNQLNLGAGTGPNSNLDVAERAVIRSRIQAEQALEDPTTLRNRFGTERPEGAPDQPDVTPGEGQVGPRDGAGEGDALGPSGPGTGNDGQQGPHRDGQSK